MRLKALWAENSGKRVSLKKLKIIKGPPLYGVHRCQVTGWNQSKSNIYSGQACGDSLNGVFSLVIQPVVFSLKGTKDQLSVLTNDIRGNANVVRTKLKCNSANDAPPHLHFYWTTLNNAAFPLIFEAMEQSMPKDDVTNRSSVDFRIQRTQVRTKKNQPQVFFNTKSSDHISTMYVLHV